MSDMSSSTSKPTSGTTSSLVLLDIEDRGEAGRVARVTFNNPTKRNALGVEGKARFIELMASIKHDQSLRALVVTGAGDRAFVGGSNLAQMKDYDLDRAEASATLTHRMCDALRQFPVPTIARINGYCFGSGMELAACADMRVATRSARFGMPEVRFGIPSGMEASVLPRLIGWGKACELVLTGDHIDAEHAYRIGFLERLVDDERDADGHAQVALDAAVESWLQSILACGPNAVRIQKRLIMDWDRMGVTDGARAGIQAYVRAYESDEPYRMMSAFVNRKRNPSQ
ncbi:MAG: enoyl-CoA hydratase/isomerase family protein [Gammaproteobacteria bacterium]|nr:enoyl-CoA hydratase/isomerase family protein [Gammaproteobacteria bacterium]